MYAITQRSVNASAMQAVPPEVERLAGLPASTQKYMTLSAEYVYGAIV